MAKFILSAFADEADQSLEQQIAALQEEKITLIELRGVDGKSCADLTLEEADSIRRKLDRSGISLSALGSPYGKYPIEAPFSDHFEQFCHGLALCRRLGCQRMRMFSFFIYINSVRKYPVVLALRMSLDATSAANWNQVLAMATISLLPGTIIFFSAQKYFVEGVSAGSIKG